MANCGDLMNAPSRRPLARSCYSRRMNLKYSMLPGRFAVCRLPADSPAPTIPNTSLLFSVTRTADELSIVCLQEDAPDEAKVETGWVCFKLHGPFAFAQTGILA